MSHYARLMRMAWVVLWLGVIGHQSAWSQTETVLDAVVEAADLTVLVFENGLPVEDVELTIADQSGFSDVVGMWQAGIEPGNQTLALMQNEQTLARLRLNLQAGELIQIIVTLKGEDRKAFVAIESSKGILGERLVADTGVEVLEGEGRLAGVVRSSEDNRPIGNARLFVSGTPIEAQTDDEGRFDIELPVGTYSVSVLHGEFATRTVEGVVIGQDEEANLDFSLPPAGLELAEFVVLVPFISGSLSSVTALRRESTAVTDVLSAEQISRTGDSDAGSALKRVTGLTLVDGQFIYVRGLGERYSSVLLNGAFLPSPDPTRRVIPMSLFPTSVIEQIVIQKTADASMPGDFGGGTVQLGTVSYPDSFLFKLGVSSGYNTRSTEKKGLTYPGGERDWSGYDDGSRDVPDLLASRIANGEFLRIANIFNPDGVSPEELEALGEEVALASSYETIEKTLPLDRGFSASLGNKWQPMDGLEAGILAGVRYSDQWRLSQELRQSFRFSKLGLQPKDALLVDITSRSIDLSGFLNAGVTSERFGRVGLNLMLFRQSEDETRLSQGEEDSQSLQRYRLQWTENELLAGQLFGHHQVPLIDTEISWQWTEGEAHRDDPNTREWRRDDDYFDGEFLYSRRADSNSQSWTQVRDDLANGSLSLKQPLPALGPLSVVLLAGAAELERNRDSTIRTFGFSGRVPLSAASLGQEDLLSEEFIAANRLRFSESTTPTDNYSAEQRLESLYAQTEVSLWDRVSLIAGMREEKNFQKVISNNLTDPTAPPTVGLIDETDQLWSGTLTGQLTDKLQARVGFAQTLSRPDFREISPSPFLDPLIDLRTVGNPDLKVASIENYDARLEYYFNTIDSVSVAYFKKDLTNPIERITSSGGSGTVITLQNALGASVEGFEIDFYRSLGFINDWVWLDQLRLGWITELGLERFYLAANYAEITSEVSIDPDASNSTNTDRPLQGASPWVVNAQLGYESDSGHIKWTLAYNEFGKRISRAGTLGQPDIYEQPFAQLDFNFSYQLTDRLSLGLDAGNLLDPKVKFTQGVEVTRASNRGHKYGISLGFSW